MGINDFYRNTLGVSLRNPLQSWGAFDPRTNRVFLTVWKDQVDESRKLVRVLAKEPWNSSTGYPERRSHIERIQDGADGFGVLGTARNTGPTLHKRSIKGFEPSHLLELGVIIKRNGDFYARIIRRLSLDDIPTTRTTSTSAEESAIEGLKTEYRAFKTTRSRKLRDAAYEAACGVCAVCLRDYSKIMGGLGERVLQVHHCLQLSTRKSPSVTKLSDLAVVCANCHLLLHIDSAKPLSVQKLQKMLRAENGE